MLKTIPKKIPKRIPRNCGCRRARGVASLFTRLLPRSSFLFFLRCSAAPLPTFACPSPSFCSFCSSSHPRSIPSLLLAFCTSSSSWLALLLLYGNLLMFRHVSERVVLPPSRKFAEGRGGRRFLEQGILEILCLSCRVLSFSPCHLSCLPYLYDL